MQLQKRGTNYSLITFYSTKHRMLTHTYSTLIHHIDFITSMIQPITFFFLLLWKININSALSEKVEYSYEIKPRQRALNTSLKCSIMLTIIGTVSAQHMI